MAPPVAFLVATRIAALGWMLGGFLLVAVPGVAAGDAEILSQPTTKFAAYTHEIKDPYYGTTLFELYQDHDFTALTELMASQYFGRVSHHSEEAELLRGGILLSYGLHREAGALFEHLIDSGTAPATQDRAWFYLAKIRYQRGYSAQAEAALQHIGNSLPKELQEERALLQANLLMARGAYGNAVTVLQAQPSGASDYVTYNLAIALIKSGQTAGGMALLNQLGLAGQADEEHRALRDRANLALGFSTLADNQPLKNPAGVYFERIRLNSKESSKALLGMGWASVAGKDYMQALIPWQELALRDDNDTAELEAKIAVPYAYAELGALGQSARLYNAAINAFDQEDAKLDESISAIQSGLMTEALLADNPGHDMGWFWQIRAVPAMPHAAHLAHVLAQHEFQEAFKNYRDLLFLSANLEQWRDKLGVFDNMLENRRKAFAAQLMQVTEKTRDTGIDALQARLAVLQNQTIDGVNAADGVAFADARQLALLKRSSNAQNLIQSHPGDAEFSAAQQRLRLARGALLWQLAQDYPQRSWDTSKNLRDIGKQLERATQLEADLQQARHDEPLRFDQLQKRIEAIAATINSTLPRIAALTRAEQLAVQDIAVAELNHEKTLLIQYSGQARFALAQLYDRGSDDFRQEAFHAIKP